MDQVQMETYVDQVVNDAERTFGAEADPALLESYAREAVLDLWLTRARVTVYVAELALSQVRDEIERRAQADSAPASRAA
jgi:hypothetical protein